jgi:hypothetical protein
LFLRKLFSSTRIKISSKDEVGVEINAERRGKLKVVKYVLAPEDDENSPNNIRNNKMSKDFDTWNYKSCLRRLMGVRINILPI